MQESEWFFLESKKDGIEEFEVFDVVVDHVVEFETWSPCIVVADGVKETVLPPNWNDLLTHENEEESAARTEDDVMELKEEGEFERLLVASEFSESKDHREVDDDRSHDGRPSGEWCPFALIMDEIGGEGWKRNVLKDEVGEVEHGC